MIIFYYFSVIDDMSEIQVMGCYYQLEGVYVIGCLKDWVFIVNELLLKIWRRFFLIFICMNIKVTRCIFFFYVKFLSKRILVI